VIRFLIASSALWRILRDDELRSAWSDIITIGAIGSCAPQRAEFKRSARTTDEFEEMSAMFEDLYPDAAVPKAAWQWIDSAQYRLVRKASHRALSAVDLLICATAAHHDIVILHDDKDFAAASRHLPDVRERSIYQRPEVPQA
jgi:predicted nucleic acid-binding protein